MANKYVKMFAITNNSQMQTKIVTKILHKKLIVFKVIRLVKGFAGEHVN